MPVAVRSVSPRTVLATENPIAARAAETQRTIRRAPPRRLEGFLFNTETRRTRRKHGEDKFKSVYSVLSPCLRVEETARSTVFILHLRVAGDVDGDGYGQGLETGGVGLQGLHGDADAGGPFAADPGGDPLAG